MALAVLSVGGLYLFIPADFRISEVTRYAYPAFLVAFLLILIVGDPGRINRDQRWLRVVTGLMIATITVVTAASVVRLVVGILQHAAFTGPEQTLPELEVSGWYPQYIDYVALSFNTSTAFSPADVSAVRHWSKLMLILQSFISLSVLVLVVARAVNIL